MWDGTCFRGAEPGNAAARGEAIAARLGESSARVLCRDYVPGSTGWGG